MRPDWQDEANVGSPAKLSKKQAFHKNFLWGCVGPGNFAGHDGLLILPM
jgi:hypothetical protein